MVEVHTQGRGTFLPEIRGEHSMDVYGEDNQYLVRNNPLNPVAKRMKKDCSTRQTLPPVSTTKDNRYPSCHPCPWSFLSLMALTFGASTTTSRPVPKLFWGDIVALKRLTTWKKYIPGGLTCIVVTSEFKVLRKVSVSQTDDESINFTQIVEGSP